MTPYDRDGLQLSYFWELAVRAEVCLRALDDVESRQLADEIRGANDVLMAVIRYEEARKLTPRHSGTGDRPELLSTSADGKRQRYRYRAHEFDIERGWVMWWCHSGISIPVHPEDEPIFGDSPFYLHSICHEAGWASLSKRSILRKLRRVINAHIRDEDRRREVKDGPAFANRLH